MKQPVDRRRNFKTRTTNGLRTIGLMQLFASSLLCYGVSRFGEHPYLLLGSLVFSIVFTAIGAWNLADRG